jgi:hypothetical protein
MTADNSNPLVIDAIAARRLAEQAESQASPSRWREADAYAQLAEQGWTQVRIAAACGTTQSTVSRFIATAMRYRITEDRPSFWRGYETVTGKREKKRGGQSKEMATTALKLSPLQAGNERFGESVAQLRHLLAAATPDERAEIQSSLLANVRGAIELLNGVETRAASCRCERPMPGDDGDCGRCGKPLPRLRLVKAS